MKLEIECIVCETNPQKVDQRCTTCYEYRRRNGVDRPRELADRQGELNRRRQSNRAHRRGNRGPRLPKLAGPKGFRGEISR